jgi:hypothetical protein
VAGRDIVLSRQATAEQPQANAVRVPNLVRAPA